MQKVRRALASPRNARDQFAPRARAPFLPSTQLYFTLGRFALVFLTAPSENGSVRSCSRRGFRYT